MQVIVLGHPLSKETMAWIRKEDPTARIYNAHLHVTRFDRVVEEVEAHVRKLMELKFNPLQLGDRTIIVPPGSSTAAMVLVGIWAGLTGQMPEILNVIRVGNDTWIPSPETPSIGLDSLKEKLRRDRKNGMGGSVSVHTFNGPSLVQKATLDQLSL